MIIRTGLTRNFKGDSLLRFSLNVIVKDGVFSNGTVTKSIHDGIILQTNATSLTDKILDKLLNK